MVHHPATLTTTPPPHPLTLTPPPHPHSLNTSWFMYMHFLCVQCMINTTHFILWQSSFLLLYFSCKLVHQTDHVFSLLVYIHVHTWSGLFTPHVEYLLALSMRASRSLNACETCCPVCCCFFSILRSIPTIPALNLRPYMRHKHTHTDIIHTLTYMCMYTYTVAIHKTCQATNQHKYIQV